MTLQVPSATSRMFVFMSDITNGKSLRAFTLVEVLIYIALLTILLTSVIVTVYPIFSGAERTSSKITNELETAFVLRKFGWAFSSIASVSNPASNTLVTTGSALTLTTQTGAVLSFTIDGSVFKLTKNGTEFPLTNGRVVFSNFQVTNTPPSGATPRSFDIAFLANGAHVGPVKYYARF